MNSAKVQVLLSTYNGRKFLKDQIDSILNQDYSKLELLIRDDGSIDDTIDILERYSKLKHVHIVRGSNIGVAASFFTLLEASSPYNEYYAFSDQDDVWMKDKVSRAISLLVNSDSDYPAMYCSSVTITDENLKIISNSEMLKRELSFANALVQNVATGCTIVINNAARQLILKKLPKTVAVHDWWIYIVISAFGKVIYDKESRILYRQHATNTIGTTSGFFNKWGSRIERFAKHGGIPFITIQAKEFCEIFGTFLSFDKKKILTSFINDRYTFISRLRYALSGETYRQSKLDDLIFKVLIVLNRI